MCGEQLWREKGATFGQGSPPRVRGTGGQAAAGGGAGRITPACAGNRRPSSPRARKAWDHPRVCGEQVRKTQRGFLEQGSPPRVRGTGTCPIAPQAERRITPACAGNSIVPQKSPSGPEDHPRVCGEQHRTTKETVWPGGSPPRVRGTAPMMSKPDYRLRITPACAGKRRSAAANRAGWADHPRVCGEKTSVPPPVSVGSGSPPRVRGKVVRRINRGDHIGITPACAGKSAAHTAIFYSLEDHPRVCGEKGTERPTASWTGGSPPRVRGTVIP